MTRLRRRRAPELMSAASRLIVALDSNTLQDALHLAKQLRGVVHYAKIGSTLFTAVGPVAIQRLRALGFEVMLDLKFLDIPSTVEKSCRAAVQHRVWMLTVHASGQPQMLEAAAAGVRREAARLGVRRPRVIGVTVLTSVDVRDRQATTARVLELSTQAKRAGLDGVVVSAWEVPAVRRRLGNDVLVVCPGIRPLRSPASDQKRVASPREALARGADFLVVGRPISEAKNPRRAVQQILAEINFPEEH